MKKPVFSRKELQYIQLVQSDHYGLLPILSFFGSQLLIALAIAVYGWIKADPVLFVFGFVVLLWLVLYFLYKQVRGVPMLKSVIKKYAAYCEQEQNTENAAADTPAAKH